MRKTPRAERGGFAGHETFPLRYGWLTKAVRETANGADIFSREDAMVRLGVGKNMVRAIRHWGLACGMLEEAGKRRGQAVKVSPLGHRLLGENGWDPYLEDPATLWLVHYELATKPSDATTWFWLFNRLPQLEFTKADIVAGLRKLAEEKGWREPSLGTLERDVEVCIRTYVSTHSSRGVPAEDTLDCPLAELGLITDLGRGSYSLQRGEHPTLPDELFGYALLRHIEHTGISSKAIPKRDIAFAAGAPGRVFALTEDGLMARLDRLERTTKGALSFQETAGLQQVYLNDPLKPLDLLGRFYGRRAKELAA